MKRSPSLPVAPTGWRQVGSSLALAASLAFAFQPTLVMGQIQVVDPDAPVKVQPKPQPPAKPKKVVHRHTPTDNVSDDLNRREAERAAQVVQHMSAAPAQAVPQQPATPVAPAPAPKPTPTAAAPAPTPAPSEPPTEAAIAPWPPVVTASLTPDINAQTTSSGAGAPGPATPAPVVSTPSPGATPKPVSQPRTAQTQPPASPVPIQPPASGAPRPAQPPGTQPPVITGAPSRTFAQSQLVPTQQPTLTLEIHKGTAIKLPGAAATVFVAAPDIADVQVKSPTMIYVFGKKPGDTVLYAVDDQDRILLNTVVSVTSPISRMKGALDALHPGNGVVFDNQGETIVLSGTVRSAVIAEDARRLALQQVNNVASKVISNIRVNAPNQVQLRVKIAEVKRDALKRIGVNWQNIGAFGISGLNFALATVSATGGTASAAATYSSSNLNALIDFLATNNMATVLAEPNLIAMSGETASFLAGGEIPVIAPQAGLAGSTIAVSYKQVGVSLAFTPTIIGDRINLKVAPEVSQLSTTGSINVPLTTTSVVTVPAVQTRRATTTIELGSGQSFAIAGLLLQSSQQDITKMPWLGDVPILGSLFKSDAYQRSESELVIIITPYLVEPTSEHLRTPLTGRVPPTDADRLVYQRFNHPTPPQRLAVGREQQSAGPTAGFKLD